MGEFSGDVVKYNTWFEDMRDQIIREEGPDQYNEYLRNLFRAYLTCPDQEFIATVNEEKRKWMQGKLGTNYTFEDLLELGRVTYNNLVEDNSWKGTDKKIEQKGSSSKDENKFLALFTNFLEKNGEKGAPSEDGKKQERQFLPWRFENPNNESTKLVRGTTMRWCTNDCHSQPMWCGRQKCLNKADYAKMMNEKRQNGQSKDSGDVKKPKYSEDFKIALAAMTSTDDYKTLTSQFFQEK